MKRLILPFAIALGLSLGITTGIAYVRKPAPVAHPPVKTDSTKVDSAKLAAHSDSVGAPETAGAGHDSVASAPVTPPPAPPGTPPAVTPPAVDPHKAPNVAAQTGHDAAKAPVTHEAKGPLTVPVKTASADAPNAPGKTQEKKTSAGREVHRATPDSAVEKRLAKVFAAMQSKDAARVLMQMDDADVQTILASLNGKQQAAILGSFPAPRAAKLAQSALHGSADL
jgi:hypothetical protein